MGTWFVRIGCGFFFGGILLVAVAMWVEAIRIGTLPIILVSIVVTGFLLLVLGTALETGS
jgi:hypothetical protein